MNKIAITILSDPHNDGLSSIVDGRFGRAEAFLIVNWETDEVVDTVDNSSVNAAHGAGTSAASILKSKGVSAVVSGRYGPKASEALHALGIETWIAPPGIRAKDALAKFKKNALKLA
jgi:predicted Fe-Mo cluster-binding NifX family protein